MINPRSLEGQRNDIEMRTYARNIANELAEIVAGGGEFTDDYTEESEVRLCEGCPECDEVKSSQIPSNEPIESMVLI
jgi:hypothetical protein